MSISDASGLDHVESTWPQVSDRALLNHGICIKSDRATPTTTSATAAPSAAACSPAAISAAMPPTCAVHPTPTPRLKGVRNMVAESRMGSETWTSPLLNAVPAATHSSCMSGMPLGMVSASPVDLSG